MTRPQDPSRPCPACGQAVEPLRAPEVVLLDSGMAYLCSAACRARFLSTPALSVRGVAPALSVPRRTPRAQPRPLPNYASASSSQTGGFSPPPTAPPPTLGLALAAAALLVAGLSTSLTLASISSVFTVGGALVALVFGAHLRGKVGWLAWASTPVGAILAAAGGLLRVLDGGDGRIALAGAAVAMAVAHLRWWLDASSEGPLSHRIDRIGTLFPSRTRGASSDPHRPLASGPDVEVERLCVGEEILLKEGDVLPCDGVVRFGDGEVLLHPSARAPARRNVGDGMLAGARVTSGRLRVLATRVGSDRALLRPAQFGDARAADAAPPTRFAGRLLDVAGLVVLAGGAVALFFAAPGGDLALRLSAAGATLIALPMISLRRASSSSYVVGALAAAERGISLRSARSLDRAGRVTVAVLATHGTVTEGQPEVVEVHGYGEGPVGEALALAAAAEASLGGGHQPIGRALVRWMRHAALPTVRRVQAVSGRGVKGLGPAGESVLVGNRQLLLEEGVSIAVLESEAGAAEGRGHTALLIAIDRKVRALVALRDEERPGARAAIQRLIDLGIEAILISGAQRGTAEVLARNLDIEHVKAELSPEERGAEIRRLRDAGNVVAVIGHAGRDEEALSAADVPIVLSAAGTPEGDRAVSLTTDDVRDASAVLWLAQAVRREAVRGVAVATVSGALLAVLGAVGLLGPGIVALIAGAVDLAVLPTSSRLDHRIRLRLPTRG